MTARDQNTGGKAAKAVAKGLSPIDRIRALGADPESRALVSAVASGVIGLLVGIGVFWGQEPPLFASGASIGTVAILVSLATAGVSFIWSTLRSRPLNKWLDGIPRWRRVLGEVALFLTHLAITLFGVTGAFAVLALAFRELTLPALYAAALVGMSSLVAAYATSVSADESSTLHLATLITMLMGSGTLTAMLTSPDPTWWAHNFSYLGGGGAQGLTFDGTLIVGGLVLLVLADRVTYDLVTSPATNGANTKVVRVLLIVSGIFCALTGLLPFDVYEPVHASFALVMLLSFIALMVLVPTAIPGLPAAFRPASYALIGVPVGSLVLFWLQAFTWTGIELVSALGVFAWLVVFVRAISSVTSPPPSAR